MKNGGTVPLATGSASTSTVMVEAGAAYTSRGSASVKGSAPRPDDQPEPLPANYEFRPYIRGAAPAWARRVMESMPPIPPGH